MICKLGKLCVLALLLIVGACSSTPPQESVPTQTAPGQLPKACSKWFDGCNTCEAKNGKLLGCTRKLCPTQKQPYCIRYHYQ